MFSPKGSFQIQTPNKIKTLMIFSFLLSITYLFSSTFIFPSPIPPSTLQDLSLPTSLEHIVFGIASNEKSWSSRKNYVRLWWKPNQMKGCVFLEKSPPNTTTSDVDSLPPLCISEDTSRFLYTFNGGLPSAIRIARVVSETVRLNHSDVRWFVFGDDDTIFFPDNLVKTLSKYDHDLWFYIGTNSEHYAANKLFSYNMAFGGAGFAISYPLAKILAKVLDSCLDRYPHVYGSDSRIHACLTELGMDFHGNIFGFLASHPLRPLVSLHHLDAIDPIFPNMQRIESLQHLFQAVSIDSLRIMQQTVCYDHRFSWTISVSWGYAVQIFPQNILLPDALRTQETYSSWRKVDLINSFYEVDTVGYNPNPCTMPPVFFLEKVLSENEGIIKSTYRKRIFDHCTFNVASPRNIEEIKVFSHKQELDDKQIFHDHFLGLDYSFLISNNISIAWMIVKIVQAPRRQCCDLSHSFSGNVMEIRIGECGDEEHIFMHH